MEKIQKYVLIINSLPIIGFLRNQWILFWNWIKMVHSHSDEASSKRFYGGIIILNCIIVFDLFSKGVFKIGDWNTLYSAWFTLLFVGVALISISTLEKLSTIIANFKIKKLFGQDSLKEE